MKIRVAHIVQTLAIGGLERVVADLVYNSKNSQFQHFVFCLDDKGDLASEVEKKGIAVIELNKNGLSLVSIFKLASLLKSKNISVTHTHNVGPLLYGGIASRIARIPVLLHSKHGRNYRGSNKNILINKFIYRFTDKVVAVSDNIAEFAIQNERISPSKLTMIRNCIDLDKFNPDKYSSNNAVEEFNLPKSDYLVGIVARLSWEKDISTLLKAFSLLLKEKENTSLVIAGDGHEKDNLKALIKELGITNKVFFLGKIDKIPEALSSFSMFVLPSISEGTPITIMEAMAMGLPIVATDVGGNSELIENAKSGFIVKAKDVEEMKNAMLRIISDKELASFMGKNARERAHKTYGLDSMIGKYEDLYRSLLQYRGLA